MSATAAGSSLRSINVLITTPKVTSPTGSSVASGGLEVATSTLALAAGYSSEAMIGAPLAPVMSLAEGLGGGDDGAGSGALSLSASSHSLIRLVSSSPKNIKLRSRYFT